MKDRFLPVKKFVVEQKAYIIVFVVVFTLTFAVDQISQRFQRDNSNSQVKSVADIGVDRLVVVSNQGQTVVPRSLTIKVGQVVGFKSQDGKEYTVLVNQQQLRIGSELAKVTFPTAGEFTFELSENRPFVGKIIVKN